MTLSLPRGWWGYHWSPPHPRSILELIRAGTLDPRLAATLWLLIEARSPLVVAARPPLAGKSTLLTALLDFLPADVPVRVLHGRSEGFDWLPESRSLLAGGTAARGAVASGTSPGATVAGATVVPVARGARGYLLAAELSSHLPIYTWGAQARIALRAARIGYSLATTAHADSPAELVAELQSPPVSLRDDDLEGLGVVLVLRMIRADGSTLDPTDGTRDVEVAPFEAGLRRRVVSVSSMQPAVPGAGKRGFVPFTTWSAEDDRFVHRTDAVDALAARAGRTSVDFVAEREARADYLERLVRAGAISLEEAACAIRAYASPTRPISGPPLAATGHVTPHVIQDHT